MVFKPESIRERLKRLEEVIARLEKHQGVSREAFLLDMELQWIVERGFILAAECVADVAGHILSGKYMIHPVDQESAIHGLRAQGVISIELFSKLRGLGGFRNILVHQYLRVDPARVHEFLKAGLDPLREFIAQTTLWLAST